MAILDIIILICFVPAIVGGVRKGFVRQVVSFVAILVAAWAAFRFSSQLSMYLAERLEADKGMLHIACFAVIVISITLLLQLLARLLTGLVKAMTLGWLNTLLGLVFSLLKTCLITGLIIMIFEGVNASFGIVSPEELDKASVYCAMRDIAHRFFPYLKELVTGMQ